jgi:hypothetical protein
MTKRAGIESTEDLLIYAMHQGSGRICINEKEGAIRSKSVGQRGIDWGVASAAGEALTRKIFPFTVALLQRMLGGAREQLHGKKSILDREMT